MRNAIDGAINARALALDALSAAWPCDYPAAAGIKLRVAPSGLPSKSRSETPLARGILVSEAKLNPGQVQDLADAMGDILKAKAGFDLAIHVRVELSSKTSPDVAALAGINKVLRGINAELEIKADRQESGSSQ